MFRVGPQSTGALTNILKRVLSLALPVAYLLNLLRLASPFTMMYGVE